MKSIRNFLLSAISIASLRVIEESASISHAELGEYNFYLVGDASGSMVKDDCPNKKSRWDYMAESFVAFAYKMNKIDADGLGVVLFSGKGIVAKDNMQPDAIESLFNTTTPGSTTPLAEALEAALKMAKTSNKKAYIQVWTDGVPDNEAAVEKVIRDQANSQNTDEECTFQFVQVGHDAGATQYLHKLDDLKNVKFDIVNVVTVEQAEAFDKVEDLIAAGIAG